MTQHNTSSQSENTYLLDGESAIEMARLLDQDKLMTRSMDGVFSEYEDGDLLHVSSVLDIACGPGGWVHEVARLYPHIKVTGIDISKRVIDYANAQTQLLKLHNARFEVMDALKPLQFPDESFDLVNMRTIIAFMPPQQWPQFLAECRRILRPGGVIRATEVEWGFANKPTIEQAMFEGAQLLHRLGRSFSPNGYHLGITVALCPLLQQAGFEHMQQKAHVIDTSYGTPIHDLSQQDFKLLFEQARHYWIQMTSRTAEELDAFFARALAEMQEEDYSSLSYALTVWGKKPEKA